MRTILTDHQRKTCYLADLDGNLQEQKAFYDILDNRIAETNNMGAPQSLFGDHFYLTNGTISGQQTGLGMAVRAMAGDKVAIKGDSY